MIEDICNSLMKKQKRFSNNWCVWGNKCDILEPVEEIQGTGCKVPLLLFKKEITLRIYTMKYTSSYMQYTWKKKFLRSAQTWIESNINKRIQFSWTQDTAKQISYIELYWILKTLQTYFSISLHLEKFRENL